MHVHVCLHRLHMYECMEVLSVDINTGVYASAPIRRDKVGSSSAGVPKP